MSAPRMETSHRGRYRIARMPDGRAIGLGAVAKVSDKEARRRFSELVWAHGSAPGDSAPGKLTLEQWCGRMLDARPDLADGTISSLELTIAKLAACLGNPKLAAVTPARAQSFADWLPEQESRRGGSLSPHSIALHLRNASWVFAEAVKAGELKANPFAGVHAPEGAGAVSDDWRFVTLPELDNILAACPDDGWRALFALCRLAGLRSGHRGGEALGLAWADVDWKERQLSVRDQKRGRQRLVPMSPELFRILRAAFERAEDRSGPVCGVSTSNLDRHAKAIVRAAGLEPWSKPFHALRKSRETEWLNDPALPIAMVTKWLGNSAAVALKHYHHRESAAAAAVVTGKKS